MYSPPKSTLSDAANMKVVQFGQNQDHLQGQEKLIKIICIKQYTQREATGRSPVSPSHCCTHHTPKLQHRQHSGQNGLFSFDDGGVGGWSSDRQVGTCSYAVWLRGEGGGGVRLCHSREELPMSLCFLLCVQPLYHLPPCVLLQVLTIFVSFIGTVVKMDVFLTAATSSSSADKLKQN